MYKLGKHSIKELVGVNANLVRVVTRAIQITDQDFTVVDGLRTKAEQTEYVARGVSQTMNSMHLPQADGYGRAVDLVPWINGKLRWELEPSLVIARAMREAGKEFGVKLRWGGCWMRLDGTVRDPAVMVEEYISRRRRQGKRPFVDAPHYEIVF